MTRKRYNQILRLVLETHPLLRNELTRLATPSKGNNVKTRSSHGTMAATSTRVVGTMRRL